MLFVGNGGYIYYIAVTFHSGRYTLCASDLRVSNVLGRRPMIIAVENAEVDTREHCGLARSTPLQRGTPHTFALTSLSTSWHSSHAASHDHPGFLPEPHGTSSPCPLLATASWPTPGHLGNATAPMKLQLSKRPKELMAGKPPSPAQARIAAECTDFLGCFTYFLQPVDRRRELPAAQVCSIQQT